MLRNPKQTVTANKIYFVDLESAQLFFFFDQEQEEAVFTSDDLTCTCLAVFLYILVPV